MIEKVWYEQLSFSWCPSHHWWFFRTQNVWRLPVRFLRIDWTSFTALGIRFWITIITTLARCQAAKIIFKLVELLLALIFTDLLFRKKNHFDCSEQGRCLQISHELLFIFENIISSMCWLGLSVGTPKTWNHKAVMSKKIKSWRQATQQNQQKV